MDINRDEYEKRLENMGNLFKELLNEAYMKALAYHSQNKLPAHIYRIEITGGASKTLLMVNIMNDFCANHQEYDVGLSIHVS